MKKLIIFLIIILATILISYVAYENGVTPTLNNNQSKNPINSIGEQISNTTKNETVNSTSDNNKNDDINEKEEEYIGKEEQESQDNEKEKENKNEGNIEENNNVELTGKEKAVDIVTKEYALNGETVRFDHMEAGDYIIKINNGTAVTWYIVDGKTWQAEEY